MKKILLTTLTFAMAATMGSFAQTNLDLEAWSGIEADGWGSLNTYTLFGAPQTLFQDTTNPGEGLSSAKIKTGYWAGATGAGAASDTVGGIFSMGTAVPGLAPLGVQATFSITSIDFLYKAFPGPGDTAAILVQFTHWDEATNMTMTDAIGIFKAGDTVSTWTSGTIYMIPLSASTPDTMVFMCSSSGGSIGAAMSLPYVDGAGANGSEFYVDAFVFNGVCDFPMANFTSMVTGMDGSFTDGSMAGTIFSENFDAYNDGEYAAMMSPYLSTWSAAPGTGEDAFISSNYAMSGANSMNINGPAGGGSTDIWIPFASDLTSGTYTYSMNMYIPSGFGAYFNLQQSTVIAAGWMLDVFFDGSGLGEIYGGSGTATPFTFTNDAWTSVSVTVNLDIDTAWVYIDGSMVHSYLFSSGYDGGGTTKSWGGVNLYSLAGPSSGPGACDYYVDDIWFGAPAAYAWDFNDGNSSTDQNPSNTYAAFGTYNVCLTVTDMCGSSTYCEDVTIVDTTVAPCNDPVGSFTSSVTGYTASLADGSTTTGTATYAWDFGDGQSSTDQNPSNTYAAAGTYTITMIVMDSCGTDTASGDVTIADTTGILSPELATIKIYPNPASVSVTIETGDFGGTMDVELYDVIGKVMRIEENIPAGIYKLERGELKNGLYLLKVRTENGELLRRIIFE
jgi:PKD repeat protein